MRAIGPLSFLQMIPFDLSLGLWVLRESPLPIQNLLTGASEGHRGPRSGS